MAHPFFEAQEKIARMRKAANLLGAVDEVAPSNFLLEKAEIELAELETEVETHGNVTFSERKLQGEFDDVYVFFVSWLLSRAPHVDSLATVHTANGYGAYSSAFERLGPVILDAADDPNLAVPEFVNRFFSIGLHLPTPYVTFSNLERTIGKVLSNRHPWLYNTHCLVLGRELEGEELLLKYLHLEKGTRMIREMVDRTLVVADWWPHRQRLVDWTNSDVQLAALAAEVKGLETTATPQLENAKMNIAR